MHSTPNQFNSLQSENGHVEALIFRLVEDKTKLLMFFVRGQNQGTTTPKHDNDT
jgi:hypothetical protein